jgi:phosphopantothenoylcysteine decarboxylase / phosphopantothenate---cysteine ligase
MSNILFGVTGSIAAFKAAATISKLVKDGHTVQVVATANALKFVGAATFEGLTGRPVFSDVYAQGQMMDHIHLARWADLFLIAPASAATLNRLAYGLAEDAIGNLFLAIERSKPVFVAPAMNTQMYSHPAVQEGLDRLRGFGVKIIEPGAGALACGESGTGRMAEPEEILRSVDRSVQDQVQVRSSSLAETVSVSETETENSSTSTTDSNQNPNRPKVLITSGGTREPIDGVRSLTNFSTGQTGATLAENFAEAGYAVTFVHAKNSALPKNSSRIQLLSFESFSDLEDVLHKSLSTNEYTAVLHLAAVSDFAVNSIGVDGTEVTPSRTIKLGSEKEITLHLKQNPKLVTRIREWSKNKTTRVIAYKLTNTPNIQERNEAISKLLDDPRIDFVVHNDLSEISETSHPFRIYGDSGFTRTGKNKTQMAQELLQMVTL